MRFLTTTACALLSSALLFAQPASAGGTLRAEAVVGWDQVAQGLSSTPTLNVSYPNKVNGAVYGGGIGYDLAVAPALTIGADLEVTGSTGRYNGVGDTSFRIGRDLYAGGRVSLMVMPLTRIYAKLGYANGNFTNQQSLLWRGTMLNNNVSQSVSGVRAGIGVQQTIFGPAYVMAEYRYTRYNAEFTRNQIVTGVGIRF